MLFAKAALFTILCVVIYRVLADTPWAASRARLLLAIAVSLLCVLGVWGARDTPDESRGGSVWVPVILLPYGALAISILLLPIVLLAVRFGRWWSTWTQRRRGADEAPFQGSRRDRRFRM